MISKRTNERPHNFDKNINTSIKLKILKTLHKEFTHDEPNWGNNNYSQKKKEFPLDAISILGFLHFKFRLVSETSLQ